MSDFIFYLEQYQFGANTAWDYALAIGVFLGTFIILKLFQLVVLVRLKKLATKTQTELDDVLIDTVRGLRPTLALFVSLYIGYRFLTFSELADQIVGFLIFAVVVYEVIVACGRLMTYFIEMHAGKQEEERERKQAMAMMRIVRGFVMAGLWIIAVVLILSNYGVNVSSIIASLGIGGLAVALAMQNILTDIFSSFSIFIDKPFQVGDFITVGQHSGTVQKIGLKTTRLKTLLGEEMVISNKELTSARVQNFKKMQERRVVFTLGVVYGLPMTELRSIPKIIRTIVKGKEGARFDRCHFVTFGASSLDFEVVYYVESADYKTYLDIKQKINFEIYREFEKAGIEFAYPTQTLYIEK